MGTLANRGSDNYSDPTRIREQEIRLHAVQAAATFYGMRTVNTAGGDGGMTFLLEKAREIEAFIESGRIPEVDNA